MEEADGAVLETTRPHGPQLSPWQRCSNRHLRKKSRAGGLQGVPREGAPGRVNAAHHEIFSHNRDGVHAAMSLSQTYLSGDRGRGDTGDRGQGTGGTGGNG